MAYEFNFKHFFKRYPRFSKRFGESKSVEDLYEFLKSAESMSSA